MLVTIMLVTMTAKAIFKTAVSRKKLLRLPFHKKGVISGLRFDHHLSGFQDIPCPPPGTYLAETGTNYFVHNYSLKWHRNLGPVFREDLGAIQAVFIACPLISREVFQKEGGYPVHVVPQPWTIYLRMKGKKRGLFFLDGEEWWVARKRLNPLFLKSSALAGMQEIVNNGVERLLQEWKEGEIEGLERMLYSWSVETVLILLLGEDDNIRKKLDKVLDDLVVDTCGIFETSARLATVDPEAAARNNDPEWIKFSQHVDNALDTITDLVKDNLEDSGGMAKEMMGAGCEEEEVVRLVADLLLAAVDTTSITASWCLHLLAKHGEVQEEVRRQVEVGQAASCTRGLVKEAMRLYPVAPFLTRITMEETEIGGYNIPPGTLLLISTFAMGRDQNLFRDAEVVKPERWVRGGVRRKGEEENKEVIQPFAFLPFGHGKRGCIGRRLAEMALHQLVTRSAERFVLTCSGPHPQFTTKLMGVPDRPVKINVHKILGK